MTGELSKIGFLSCLGVFVLAVAAPCHAAERTVAMLPDEGWWGLCTEFGRQMPFTEKSDFFCDLRTSSYSHQTMSLLVSSRGRAIWCAEPVSVTIGKGAIRVASDKAEIAVREYAGRNLAEAYRFASRTWFPPTGGEPELLYFSAPQYNTWVELSYHQNEKDVLAYAQSMVDHGLPPGVFMIDDTWQLGYGTWEFDPRRFSDPKGMVTKLHGMGFKVVLWMCPFVSMDSPAYRLLEFGWSPGSVRQRSKGGLVTNPETGTAAVVDWWNGRSALVDLSHPNGLGWFCDQMNRLVSDYGVDAFKFDGGRVDDYMGVRAHRRELGAAFQNGLFANLALKYRGSELRCAYGMGGKPVIMRLLDKNHSWRAVARLVPDMMAAGLIGSPFICPDMVGGGTLAEFLPGATIDQELFIRSAQVHALCPMMQLSASPWRVLDSEHQRIFAEAVALRQRFADRFVELARQAARDGEPILRNLEYAYPGQGFAEIRDEFLMGGELLVAPVVRKGARTRDVVLPPGRWKADDGKVYDGPSRITVDAPLSRLPHFILLGAERAGTSHG